MVRGSLRMRSLTPWSANDRESWVDSIIPGKFLGGDTTRVSGERSLSRDSRLTSKPIRHDGLEEEDILPVRTVSSPAQPGCDRRRHSLPHLKQGELQTEFALDLDRQVAKDEEPSI